MTEPTSALLDVWELMYEKLRVAHSYDTIANDMYNFDPDGVHEEPIDNYGEYFASLGGIVLSPEFADNPRKPELVSKLTLFLNYKLVNLFSNDPVKRNRSREVLCVSMHPFLCGLILDLVGKQCARFEAAFKNKNYEVCELVINLLRTITQVEYESLFFYAVDLWDINFKILQILNVTIDDPSFLRLKLKFCKLQVLFLSKLEELSMHGNILKKNEYARIAADYLEASFNMHTDDESELNQVKGENNTSKCASDGLQKAIEDIHFDIKVEAALMLKIILFKLPMDNPYNNGTHSSEDMQAAGVVWS
ncbi:unnamed protein product [Ambrosiozyma monospora]|uniref:Unnamed protein product n=1 Tax=Ambrosiozyma monospora TaxID=43982 RepID=A0ACB5T920_AMBMO|nr:unnamed protein product [Ambrosiozyma monospora]